MRLHFEMTGDGNHNVLLMPGALGEQRHLVKECVTEKKSYSKTCV